MHPTFKIGSSFEFSSNKCNDDSNEERADKISEFAKEQRPQKLWAKASSIN